MATGAMRTRLVAIGPIFAGLFALVVLVDRQVLAVRRVSAEDRPNFSGEWVRLEPSLDPPPVLTVVQNEQTIRIETGSPGPSSGTYGSGTIGSVTGPVPAEIPRVQWSWKEDTFVVTFEGGRMIPGAVRQEVWSLDLQGRLVVVITLRTPKTPATTTRFVYAKKR
jgi:hypothetical protein